LQNGFANLSGVVAPALTGFLPNLFDSADRKHPRETASHQYRRGDREWG